MRGSAAAKNNIANICVTNDVYISTAIAISPRCTKLYISPRWQTPTEESVKIILTFSRCTKLYILPKCTILYILKKEGLLAPAIVIETVELSFLPTIATPHSRTTTHNHHPTISISSLTTHPPKPATTHHNDPPHTRQITHSTISPNYQPHPHLATRMMTASQTSMRRGRQG